MVISVKMRACFWATDLESACYHGGVDRLGGWDRPDACKGIDFGDLHFLQSCHMIRPAAGIAKKTPTMEMMASLDKAMSL